MMRLSFAAPTLIIAFLALTVNGQVSSNVTCSAQSSWMFNKLGQTPCLVSAYLSSVCNNGVWSVPTLTAQGPYNPPSGSGITVCRCNSVVYALISACSLCQGGLIGRFDDWIQNCPAPNVARGNFPESVPGTTHIPAWSLVDPTTTGGVWNVTLARQIAEEQTKNKPNTGAIVGGIVGGVAALAIVIFVIWYILRTRHTNADKVVPVSRSRRGTMDTSFHVEYPQDHSKVDLAGSPTLNISASASNPPFTTYQPRPYNPNEVLTFPHSTHPSVPTSYTGMTSSSVNYGTEASTQSHPTHGITSTPPNFPGHPGFAQPPAYHTSSPPRVAFSGAAEV